ncbi:MAG: cytochrome c maturation protein CcmE [Candidatus Puniceispirillaceae bacterium]
MTRNKGVTPKTKRLFITALAGLVLALAAWLASTALRDNIVFFVTPSQITDEHKQAKRVRIGGLVAENSVSISGTTTLFTITDEGGTIAVRYEGALPDLFREGQGIVAEGKLTSDVLIADTVLAKHDETYMPREVRESLKEQGVWQGDS